MLSLIPCSPPSSALYPSTPTTVYFLFLTQSFASSFYYFHCSLQRFRPQPQVPENSLHSLGRLPLSPASDHHGQASPFAGYHPQAPGQSPFSPFGGSPAQHAQHAQHPQHYPQHQQQQQGITSPFTGNHSAPFETASYNSGNGQPSPTAQYPTPRARVAAFEGTAATLSEEDMQVRAARWTDGGAKVGS